MVEKAVKARNIDQVLDLLMEYGKDTKLIAGGTDLIIQLRQRQVSPKVLIDISDIDELRYIKEKDEWIEIGAGATFKDLEESPYFKGNMKGLFQAASQVGSPQIRSRATVGGNICNGSPAADIVPPLLALDAITTIKSREETREVPLENFFVGKGRVALKPHELLESIKFKALGERCGLSFSKLGLRKALAISRICTSVMLQLDQDQYCKDIKIANGSLGEYGIREKDVERFFIHKEIREETIEEGLKLLKKSIDQRLHGRSSLPYKIEAVEGTFKEAMNNALAEAMNDTLAMSIS